MKISFLRVLMCATIPMVMVATVSFAANSTSGQTTGEIGTQMASALYCDTKSLFEGSLGMAIGMLMVFGGIWSMARGGKITGGIILIAFGGMFTALPAIVESFMSGLGNLLIQSGMSRSAGFQPPSCSDTDSKIEIPEDTNRCTGTATCTQ